MVRDERTIRFEKGPPAEAAEGEDDDAAGEDVWRRIEPEPADIERPEMDALLRALSDLRADSFVENRQGTGLDAPLAAITATFGDDGEEERVLLGRSGDAAYEPGAALLDTAAVDDALEALDALDPGAPTG